MKHFYVAKSEDGAMLGVGMAEKSPSSKAQEILDYIEGRIRDEEERKRIKQEIEDETSIAARIYHASWKLRNNYVATLFEWLDKNGATRTPRTDEDAELLKWLRDDSDDYD